MTFIFINKGMKTLLLVFICVIGTAYSQKGFTYVSKSKTPIIILPDFTIQRRVLLPLVEGGEKQVRDTIFINNYFFGKLVSSGGNTKTPASYFKDMEDYKSYIVKNFVKERILEEVKSEVLIKFVISKKGELDIKFIQGLNNVYDDWMIRGYIDRMLSSFGGLRMGIWKPAIDEKGNPIETEGYLIIHFDMDAVAPASRTPDRVLPIKGADAQTIE